MNETSKSRRGFLSGALASPVALAVAACARAADKAASRRPQVVIENFSAAGKSLGKVTVPRVVQDRRGVAQAAARRIPSPSRATKAPSGRTPASTTTITPTACIAASAATRRCSIRSTKFESGTGWPSFWKPISNANVSEIADQQPDDGAHRGVVQALRCAPRACVRRWAGSDRPALLHELGGAEVRGAREGV